MSRTPSTMLALGTQAPDFSLLEPTTGAQISLHDLAAHKGLVVMFICNHCPFVKHLAEVLVPFTDYCQTRGIAVVAINSNDSENYPADSPEKMVLEVKERNYRFHYLHDSTQAVAKAYAAACTPDFYLFDGAQKLIYRGQFDASRPGNEIAPSGADLKGAVDSLLAGNTMVATQQPSLGCNIKWKPGNEPDYFA